MVSMLMRTVGATIAGTTCEEHSHHEVHLAAKHTDCADSTPLATAIVDITAISAHQQQPTTRGLADCKLEPCRPAMRGAHLDPRRVDTEEMAALQGPLLLRMSAKQFMSQRTGQIAF